MDFIIRIYIAGLALFYPTQDGTTVLFVDARDAGSESHVPRLAWAYGNDDIPTDSCDSADCGFYELATNARFESISFQLLPEDNAPQKLFNRQGEETFPEPRPQKKVDAGRIDWIPSLGRILAGSSPVFKDGCRPPARCDEVVIHVELDRGILGTCRLVEIEHGGKQVVPEITFTHTSVSRAAAEMAVLEIRLSEDDLQGLETFRVVRRLYPEEGQPREEYHDLDLVPAKCKGAKKSARKCLEIMVSNLAREPGGDIHVGGHFAHYYELFAGGLPLLRPIPIVHLDAGTKSPIYNQPECQPQLPLPNLGDRPICPLSSYP
jgi:hypothetical protein